MTFKKSLKISIIGTGYVGLVTGACLAKVGHQVICIDNNRKKIEELKKGMIPIYEPGLKEIVLKAVKTKKISFVFKIDANSISDSQVIFIAVGTPSSRRGDGYADLTYVYDAAKEIAPFVKEGTVIVNKSTVPVGTVSDVERIIKKINPQINFLMASNPEFLKEGDAVNDFLNPDRVVIGVDSNKAKEILKMVYSFVKKKNIEILITDIRSAELIKYASNAFLAMKISFINEIANLCEVLKANINDVAYGLGLDKRISPYFLNPGPGYGGSCFPKDVTALLRIAQENGAPLRILEAVAEVNLAQKARMIKKIKENVKIKNNEEKTLLFLGLTYKPNTDDMRYSSALTIIPSLLEKGYKIIAHDPKGVQEAKKELSREVIFINKEKDIYKYVKKVHGIVLLTEWDIYKKLNLKKIKQLLKEPNFIDLRNLFSVKKMKEMGFNYVSLGRN